MKCAFCEIAQGARDARVLYRMSGFFVFEPSTHAKNKLLIAPVEHYQDLGEIPLPVLSEWLRVAHTLSSRLAVTSCKMQINVGVKHQNVRHLYMQFSYQKE